jgi:tripartite-type tricarboxylate transporter receptor subunit TctC
MPRAVAWIAITAAWFFAGVPVQAQEWPSRPVKIIIPLGPGGGAGGERDGNQGGVRR